MAQLAGLMTNQYRPKVCAVRGSEAAITVRVSMTLPPLCAVMANSMPIFTQPGTCHPGRAAAGTAGCGAPWSAAR